MPFADAYLKKQTYFSNPLINHLPDTDCRMVIVIPCYNEPSLLLTLESLSNCYPTRCMVEVYIIINAPISAPEEHLLRNQQTLKEVTAWIEIKNVVNQRYYPVLTEYLPKKTAGVGLARKIGMDEAVRQFNNLDRPDGIIISLDADCICERNYLREIEHRFIDKPQLNGVNIYIEHDINLHNNDDPVGRAVAQYELYLRYYVEMLRTICFPYAFHTIGSGFAVKASAYVKQGGMNRRQGGEDFYFLQKLFSLGYFEEINTTKVVPAARISNRVPFGTGPEIQKIVDKNGILEAYHPQAFWNLKPLITSLDDIYHTNNFSFLNELRALSWMLSAFLNNQNFPDKIDEIKKHTASVEAFKKRFFQWFNAFMILKYLNFAHEKDYNKQDIVKIMHELYPDKHCSSAFKWLEFMRQKQREEEYSILQ